jgi:hypothetical protein
MVSILAGSCGVVLLDFGGVGLEEFTSAFEGCELSVEMVPVFELIWSNVSVGAVKRLVSTGKLVVSVSALPSCALLQLPSKTIPIAIANKVFI